MDQKGYTVAMPRCIPVRTTINPTKQDRTHQGVCVLHLTGTNVYGSLKDEPAQSTKVHTGTNWEATFTPIDNTRGANGLKRGWLTFSDFPINLSTESVLKPFNTSASFPVLMGGSEDDVQIDCEREEELFEDWALNCNDRAAQLRCLQQWEELRAQALANEHKYLSGTATFQESMFGAYAYELKLRAAFEQEKKRVAAKDAGHQQDANEHHNNDKLLAMLADESRDEQQSIWDSIKKKRQTKAGSVRDQRTGMASQK